jgi:autotransporter strand-loop-strand O-heptosyltransferase
MAHKEQMDFCERIKQRFPDYFRNKKVLDIGSLDINGSNRYLFENCYYIGIDVAPGKNVDTVCVGHLYDKPDNFFDVIISTEAFEHDIHYEKTITNAMRMLKPGGLFLFTCAAPGRAEHGTRRTSPGMAPLLIEQSEEWSDYYKNLTDIDIRKIPNFENTFHNNSFEYRGNDLYFYGIKNGIKGISINFIDGAFVEIKEDSNNLYNVQFIDSNTNKTHFELNLKSNCWAKCNKKYFVNWLIKIKGVDNDYYGEYLMGSKDKKILISFESKALGDTLAWMPYVEEFKMQHQCNVVCSTFHNELFAGEYPNIEFVPRGSAVDGLYAHYKVGVFLTDGEINYDMHPTDPRPQPLTKISSDILGLNYVELRPRLPLLSTKKKKQVLIGIHGTAQCKYWNNPNGWQEVTDFLVRNGYKVKILSKENDGYMGNKHPKGASMCDAPTVEAALRALQESQLFIGISSGLSWLSWASGTETILISGFTDIQMEPKIGIRRIINKEVCNGCWSTHKFDPGDWNWCPVHKGTARQFECSKEITSSQVIEEIKVALGL